MRRPIRNLSSNSQFPTRVFDVIVEEERVDLEVKYKGRVERIPWQDVVRQVDDATKTYKKAVNE